LPAWGIPATGVLVETLLDRAADGDVAEAEAAIERLAAAPADKGLVLREVWLLPPTRSTTWSKRWVRIRGSPKSEVSRIRTPRSKRFVTGR
jgi:hypothetical protein